MSAKRFYLKPARGPTIESGPQGPLTDVERDRLARCESAVRQHLDGWMHAGIALLELRESRLYRATHATLEEYCQERFGLTRGRMRQIKDAAAAKHLVESGYRSPTDTNGSAPLPKLTIDNERQARALTATRKPELYCQIVQRAVADNDGNLTAKAITHAAKAVLAAAGLTRSKKPAIMPPLADRVVGWAKQFEQLAGRVRAVQDDLVAIAAEPFGLWLRVEEKDKDSALSGRVVEGLERLIELLSSACPAEVCAKCKGKGCAACVQHGWRSKAML